jgi:hypothetical protein
MNTIEEQVQKISLLEINEELRQITPPADVIDLVKASVSLSGYGRNEVKNAFFRALSLPALDIYINTDKRCRTAIDIVIHKLESRFPSKSKLNYGWKGVSSRLAGLDVIDEYGNVLFTAPWIATPDPVAPATSAPVNTEPKAQGIAPSPSPAHELALSPVYLNVSFEMLHELKETNAKLDILISRG